MILKVELSSYNKTDIRIHIHIHHVCLGYSIASPISDFNIPSDHNDDIFCSMLAFISDIIHTQFSIYVARITCFFRYSSIIIRNVFLYGYIIFSQNLPFFVKKKFPCILSLTIIWIHQRKHRNLSINVNPFMRDNARPNNNAKMREEKTVGISSEVLHRHSMFSDFY